MRIIGYYIHYAVTWLLCAFSLVVDRDLLKNTHKWRQIHVSRLVFLFSCACPKNTSINHWYKTNRFIFPCVCTVIDHRSNHVRVSPTTPNMYILKCFRFIITKIYNILRYVIARILRHMCNLHIKETEISQKRSKGIKNWKITYSVILSVLSSKTNLILGFSSPLKYRLPRTPWKPHWVPLRGVRVPPFGNLCFKPASQFNI